ncbi:WSC-domain-containing protein [Hyaloscypha variabilis F]|uniref:WSC-domain-containing protein n=1 Tax=Hyaloscypha variabilis (strain UAMH 11265 / GT02V1 / F) TaxID=1149755 RepID=A0A2J6RQ38_HYAVF|nr:WSC-domain-containing protein [Hyaloscypha variabilis F]
MSPTLVITFLLSFFVSHVSSLASTDTITWGGDNSRTGYQTNHNMDPAVVGSAQFGQLFKTALPGNYNGAAEQVFSQPLVYTTSDGVQYVYLATTQNNLYKINAKTGFIVMQRNLHIPFLTADLAGCVDINPHVGVTATGVIDPDTDTLYLTSKTYENQAGGVGVAQGRPAGRYYFHAINVNDLTERDGFPVDLEGTVARNNPIRSFNGGIHHQRPALLHSGQYIYAGWDKTTGAIVERYATEGAGVPNTTPGGGIWMSGGGLASDDAGSLFFASGNGYASQLSTIPVNGRNPPTSLEEAAVHMTINDDGSLTIVDFFMPWEKTQLDGADRDLGTSPLELLPSEFSCGDYKRIGVVTGKSGKTYWLNLDNLGGYQNGPNKLDDIIQVYQNENSVYAGAGVYPLEGGYIYINVIQYPTHVFKFSCSNGVPSFTKVADSPTKNAYVLGVGYGTTTSLNGEAGTGLVWTSDVDGQNLRVYNAVPEDGLMTQIAGFNVPGTTKFTRPVFGDGIVYMGTTQGYFYGFGSPVNFPINCSSPYDFGIANLKNATAARTVTCTANIGVTVTNITLTGSANFNITGVPSVPLNIAQGSTFNFQAYFNPQTVGSLSSDVIVATTNNVAGYSTSTPISLKGTGKSVNALLSVSPVTLAFQGAITGAQAGGVNQSLLINTQGNSPLTIQNIRYSVQSETGPWITSNTTSAGPKAGAFTFIGLPTTIPGNSAVTVTVNFDTSASGNFAAYVQVVSNGGTKVFDVVGTCGSPPVALLEFQTPDGTGWVQYQEGQNFTFGNVTENLPRSLKMRLTNNATSDSARLSLTVSKPPFGVAGIIGANNQVDLAEGTTLAPGENATATLYCSVPKEQWNTDPYHGNAQWTMNMDDPNFGKQYIQFDCLAVSEQAAPLQSNGLGLYRYTGCFKENNPGRQLKTQIYSDPNNTIAECIAACAAGGYVFCGAQYNQKCWGGPNIPIEQVSEDDCNYPCAGNVNEICGGNGVGSDAGGSYISLFADSSRFNGTVVSTAPSGPFVNPGVDGYVSMGCYTEGTNGRALVQGYDPSQQTVKMCVNTCATNNYIYAGLEYGGECWCGNSFGAGAVPTASSDCSMTCNDNATEYCGAGNRLNVYSKNGSYTSSTTLSTSSITGTGTGLTTAPTATTGPQIQQTIGNWAFQGCWTESTTGRALSSNTYAADSMTLESCASFCSAFSMFGVEYGRECYCGNALGAGSTKAPNQADCSFTCPGDGNEYCGAGNRLQLYAYNVTSTSSTSVSSSSASSSALSVSTSGSATGVTSTSPSTAPSLTGPTIVPSAGLYNYMGCFTEGANTRTFGAASYPSDSNTIAQCAAACSAYKYFGTEYGRECWCDNSFGAGSVLAGDGTAYCGAGNRLSVYIKNGTSSGGVSSSPSSASLSQSSGVSSSTGLSPSQSSYSSVISSTQTTPSPSSSSSVGSTSSASSTSSAATPSQTMAISKTIGKYAFQGCYTEAKSNRALTGASFYNYTAMTLEMCASSCSAFTWWGVEYGGECYCGDSLDLTSLNTTITDCSFSCPGNQYEYCGAGNRLQMYKVAPVSSSVSGGIVISTSSSLSTNNAVVASTSSTSTPVKSPTTLQTSSSTLQMVTSSSSATSSSSISSSSSSSATPSATSSKAATYTGLPVTSQGNVNFTYYSCISEPSSGRALSRQVENNGTYMTIEKCLSGCWMYQYAGVEYGRECWCGNTLNTGGANLNISDSGCSFTCPGNSSEYCGAGTHLNLYWFDVRKAMMNNGTLQPGS